jgi:DNA-directed RNA polymerase specialized sigma24 family protein
VRQPLALRQKRAVQRAYRRHAGDVYRYALAVLGNHGDAEEVVRRTFLKAYLRRRRRIPAGLHLNALLAIAHDLCRRRAGEPNPLEPARAETPFDTFVCGRAERAISRELDDRLPAEERRFLRAHLRVCGDCEQFRRSLRRQRAALRALASMPVPETLQPFSSSTWPGIHAAPARKFLPTRASP